MGKIELKELKVGPGWNEIAKNPDLYGISSEPFTLKSFMAALKNIAKVRAQQNYEKWIRK